MCMQQRPGAGHLGSLGSGLSQGGEICPPVCLGLHSCRSGSGRGKGGLSTPHPTFLNSLHELDS